MAQAVDADQISKKPEAEPHETVCSPETGPGFLEFAAGSAIGVVVGLVAGLSISPVTSTILGALSASLLILLGLRGSTAGAKARAHDLKVLGFGLFGSISLVAGIALRTHQVLSPSLSSQKEILTSLKVFSPDEIDQILLVTNFGLHRGTQSGTEGAKPSRDESGADTSKKTNERGKDQSSRQVETADLAFAGLLRSGSADFCRLGRREQFHNLEAYLDELQRLDPRLAQVIRRAPTNYQDDLSKSLSQYLCP